MLPRRKFLKVIAPVVIGAAIADAGAAESEEDLQSLVAQLAAALKAKHGGEWDICINGEAGSVFGRRHI
jgi:hypothetical protein